MASTHTYISILTDISLGDIDPFMFTPDAYRAVCQRGWGENIGTDCSVISRQRGRETCIISDGGGNVNFYP